MSDEARMARAIELAAGVEGVTSPNPWVGAVVVTVGGDVFEGATQPPGGAHAEAAALAAAEAAGAGLAGATVYTTLEPCAHTGRTPPCADALVRAGIARVVVGIEDPDPGVAGSGISRLRDAGIAVDVGVEAAAVAEQLAPYLKHRRTGLPWVVLKMAVTADGRSAGPDGSSKWVTGDEARADAHRLRARCDAVIVGAGTVRADDPALTVRAVPGRDPLRVVLGRAPQNAQVHPCLEMSGDLETILHELGHRGVLSVLVEGGAHVAHGFHEAGLVDRYVLYVAPALLGGDDGRPLFAGPGASRIADAWRGRFVSVDRVGGDLRVELAPTEA